MIMDTTQRIAVHIRIGIEYVKHDATKNPGAKAAARVPKANPSLPFKRMFA